MLSPTAHPLETAGRIGYAVKGVLYLLLGVLAVQAAMSGGSAEGQTGALQTVADGAFGGVLLTALAIGLAAYAAWRLALAVLDPERQGTDTEGLVHRAGYLVSAASYGTLAFAAYRILSGGGSGGDGAEEGAQAALALPGGRIALALVALGVIAYGAYEIRRAIQTSFMDKLALDGLAAKNRATIQRLGRAGLLARGVVYGLIGLGFAAAAYRYDPDEARGLDESLAALRDATYGAVLLGVVGLGLAAYGLYCGVNARYRHFEGDQ